MLKQIDINEIISYPKQLLRETMNEIRAYGMKRIPHKFFKLYENGFIDALDQAAFILGMTKTEDTTTTIDLAILWIIKEEV